MTCIIQTFYNFELRFDWHGVFPDRGIYAAGGLPVRMALRSLKMHPNTIFIRIRPG